MISRCLTNTMHSGSAEVVRDRPAAPRRAAREDDNQSVRLAPRIMRLSDTQHTF